MWNRLIYEFKIFAEYYLMLDLKWTVAGTVISALIGLILAVLAKRGRVTKRFALLTTLLVLYMLTVLSYTLLSRPNTGEYHYELTLLWSYEELFNGDIGFVEQIVLNIFLLFPMGLLLSGLGLSTKAVVGIGFGCTCTIELLQLVTTRGLFEFDDILHNTLGVLLACLVYRFFEKRFKRNKKC